MGRKQKSKESTKRWFKVGKYDKALYRQAKAAKEEHTANGNSSGATAGENGDNNGASGSMELILPSILNDALPSVSIITITKDRSLFAGIMLHNWYNFEYPKDKLEWVIVDDSQDPDEHLEQYLPLDDDKRIKYVRIKEWLDVATKRNRAVQLTSHDIIMHMDDDDYYFPDSVLAKVRVLLAYNKDVVLSQPFGVYDMMEKSSYIFQLERESNDIAEASLLYRKSYWKNNHFKSKFKNGAGEGRAFINKNFKSCINLHFLFNMISITHSKNVTGHNRRFVNDLSQTVKTGDFLQVFPESFVYILENIRKILNEKYVQPVIEYSESEQKMYDEMKKRNNLKIL